MLSAVTDITVIINCKPFTAVKWFTVISVFFIILEPFIELFITDVRLGTVNKVLFIEQIITGILNKIFKKDVVLSAGQSVIDVVNS